jgi:hypothetical protein
MDKISRLKELKQLLDDGLLTQEEFNKYKSELIDGDIKNHNDEVKTFNTSIEGNIGKEENLDNLNASFIEQKKTKDQQSEKKYVQDLSSSKTNHSYGRYILAILFFVVGGFYIFYHFVLKDKWANIDKIESQQNFDNLNAKTRFTYLTQPVDDLESMSVTGISNEQELYAYLDEVAVFWCSEWKKAQGYQNENKRFEEMLKVDRCINAYPLGFQQGLIMLNDLPMELNTKAREHFQQKVKNLGFDPFWNEESVGESTDLDEEIESFENGRSSQYNEDEFNRQQEQAEYESSQAYYNSNEYEETVPENEQKKSKIQESEILYKTTILRSPESRKDFANVFWNKEFTLFDKLTDEPIFPYKKNGLLVYKIYCSTNESLSAEYVELSPEQLQKKIAYKFLNFENCNKWIESKRRKLNKN